MFYRKYFGKLLKLGMEIFYGTLNTPVFFVSVPNIQLELKCLPLVPPIMNTYFGYDDMANSYLYLAAGLQLLGNILWTSVN